MENSVEIPLKTGNRMPHDPAIPLLGIYTKETRIERDTGTPVFIAALFTIARTCEVKVAQWCLTLCDFMDFTVHGILQATILEWVAYTFSSVSSQPRN